MTLKYILLEITATIDEVVNRAQRTSEMPEVYATRKITPSLDPYTRPFKYEVNVKVGRKKFVVETWERSFDNFVSGLDDNRPDFVAAGDYANERAKIFAIKLSQKGISVLYCNMIYSSPRNTELVDHQPNASLVQLVR